MGMDPLTIGLGVAGVSAVSGALKGAKGTSAQTTQQDSTTSVNAAPASAEELALQQQALKNYFAQSGLANQYQGSLDSADPYQAAARQSAMGILDGSAYQLTPQEQAQIAGVRNATVQAGMQDINAGLDQRYQQINNSAGMRGLRGQALAQQQGDSVRTGMQAATSLQNQANSTAAQQAMQLPYQRVASQQSAVNTGLSFADQLRQQAQANLQNASNPALMGMMQNERLATATRSTSGTNTTPGQSGSWSDALAGGLGGFASGAGTATNLMGAFNNLSAPTATAAPTAQATAGLPYNYSNLLRG